jgi:hypothetical protein
MNQAFTDPESAWRARAAKRIGQEQSMDSGTGRDDVPMNID